MSRIGKIARLPKAVREELNRRLEDGEQHNRLVEWLNGRPDVQAVLNAECSGHDSASPGAPGCEDQSACRFARDDVRPINASNMTAWVQGGFEDWRRQQETLGVAERLVEETAELGALTQGRLLADRAADLAALAIAEQLMAVRRMEEGEEKRRAILKLVRGLVRLRKTDREQERAQCEAERAQRARDYHQDWMENVRRPRKTGPFDDLSDAELMRRMEEMRALDAIAPRADVTAFEDDDEEEDSPSPHSTGDDDSEQDDEGQEAGEQDTMPRRRDVSANAGQHVASPGTAASPRAQVTETSPEADKPAYSGIGQPGREPNRLSEQKPNLGELR